MSRALARELWFACCRVFLQFIRLLCLYNHNLNNFEPVFQNQQLEQYLGKKTGCFIDTISSQISSKASNKVKITRQLSEEETKELFNLSKLILDIMITLKISTKNSVKYLNFGIRYNWTFHFMRENTVQLQVILVFDLFLFVSFQFIFLQSIKTVRSVLGQTFSQLGFFHNLDKTILYTIKQQTGSSERELNLEMERHVSNKTYRRH
ncbi:Hypothetical_protein [Hexamita inflata]|uniref:Hypothetical_protein n=1 Tax=Hexamita inflata TaxID=28002 RepID=A0AA86NVW2_9EUKA|nr:Hypothetical protein HINF_LOCUS13301 [Hexamita inflata]